VRGEARGVEDERIDLRFFRSVHRGHFYAQLETNFRRMPRELGLRNLRDDMFGFGFFDADETPDHQHLFWGNRNFHEEWSFAAAIPRGLSVP
jgi:hypothetical protein